MAQKVLPKSFKKVKIALLHPWSLNFELHNVTTTSTTTLAYNLTVGSKISREQQIVGVQTVSVSVGLTQKPDSRMRWLLQGVAKRGPSWVDGKAV